MPFQSLVNSLPTELQQALQSGVQTGAIAVADPGLKVLVPLVNLVWAMLLALAARVVVFGL